LEKRRVLGMPFHLLKKHSQAGFTILEALFASVILALGLFGSFQLSTASMAANQSQRNLDLASGLAQDLAECWQVSNALCISQFQNSLNTSALFTEAGIQFERSWNTTAISTQGTDPRLLQNLQISVKWPSQDKFNSTSELSWQIRRANTPYWVGL
jgi:Tfp pilus assembly protein PilV